DLPAENFWRGLARITFLATLALRTAEARLPFVAGLAATDQQLPTGTRTLAGIVPACNEARTIHRADVELVILLARFVSPAHLRRNCIAARERKTSPITAARHLRGIFQRLEHRAVVANNFGLIGDAVLLP